MLQPCVGVRGWDGASILGLLPRSSFFFAVLFPARPSGPGPSPSREGWFWAYRVTVDTPSTNFVLKRTLALLNIPSLRETTMNCECLKCALSIWPMFCVWERSRAASTSSRMYNGAGLKRSMERMRESATRDLKEIGCLLSLHNIWSIKLRANIAPIMLRLSWQWCATDATTTNNVGTYSASWEGYNT